ncbi:hypothetical protein [Paraburkholderia kururiensis]
MEDGNERACGACTHAMVDLPRAGSLFAGDRLGLECATSDVIGPQ